jgi:lysophospholipase L1-like esterase
LRYNRFTAIVAFPALIGRAVIVKSLWLPLFVCCSLGVLAPTHAAEKFELRDGDRVVLVGSTLIEREQRYGYWETALTRRDPDKSITFRNLGWSGDTVFGDARAGFGSQADGFRHLKEHVLALKPTVIIIGYGTNESFAGPKGLPHFVKGLETLLDAFAPTKARIVLLSPLKQEKLDPPLPDPKENNKNLRLYADAIRDMAKKRNHVFVDLYELLGKEKHPLTDDGIQLTAWGYWRSAAILEHALGLPETGPRAKEWKKITEARGNPPLFEATIDILPLPPPPKDGAPPDFRWQSPFVSVEARRLIIDPDLEQAEKLRQTIIAKNRLYFYRWRPENETYLFGFRKHEQGQNAREIPQFDPLIVEKEKEIAKLRVPVPHTYELKAEKK